MRTGLRYQQIADYYSDLIRQGKLSEGMKLPTENEIATLFDVSRITVRRALDDLAQAGRIVRQQGKGSYVSCKRTDMQLNNLVGFSDEMRSLGLEPSTKLIYHGVQTPTESVMEALEIGSGQKIYLFERLRFADNKPMALERVHLPFHRFPGIENEDLTCSFYQIIRERFHCYPDNAKQSIYASPVSKYTAELLKITPGTPALQITRITYEQNNKPFEYVLSTYRGDKYVFNVRLKA